MHMTYELDNGKVKIVVAPKGAELQSMVDLSADQEYIWEGDAAVWGKHSPVLFPIVGALKDKTYFYKGQAYFLERHGFARDKEFELVSRGPEQLVFSLKSTEATRAIYPFYFDFRIIYTLNGNSVSVTYQVQNTGNEEMWFSVGGHPAFKVPLFEGDAYSEYILEFEKEENAGKWPIEDGGLIAGGPRPFFNKTKTLTLNKALFVSDALVFKELQSRKARLLSRNTGKGFELSWPGFPFFGVWSAPGADFICLEPWCGIADAAGTTQELTEKEGINTLAPGAVFERTWTITLIG